MIKNLTFLFLTIFISSAVYSQVVSTDAYAKMINPNHNLGLTNPLYTAGSSTNVMTYDPTLVSSKGAAFSFSFVNPGGPGYKGYPSGTVGGYKTGGIYSPGVFAECGLPVQIQNLTNALRIRWKVSQQFANDPDDKWWATINVIFDNTAPQFEPNPDDRDFDLVIALKQYEQESLSDEVEDPNTAGGDIGTFWRFAKLPSGALKTFDLNYNGTVYQWAIRYKYFNLAGNDPKNNKIHVKFIPLNNNDVAPFLDHSLKKFLDAAKANITSAGLPTAKEGLAHAKVADPSLYIKSISAGYEVYTGSFTIKNDYFYTITDITAPVAPQNLTATLSGTSIFLNWDDNPENDIDAYTVYRSVNDGSFSVLADNVIVSQYFDQTTISGNKYTYYIIAKDRSSNNSAASQQKSQTLSAVLALNETKKQDKFKIYPNPASDYLYFTELIDKKIMKAEIYSMTGQMVTKESLSSQTNRISVKNLAKGKYIIVLFSDSHQKIMISTFIKD